MKAAVEDKTIVEGIVTEENKGGIVVNVKGIRVFVPASQTGMPRGRRPVRDDQEDRVKLRITEVNRARRRVVGSIRAVQADGARCQGRREVWANIEDGQEV